jgi:hypothetical protein
MIFRSTLLVLLFVCASCDVENTPRPETDAARADFEQRYPDAIVLDIRVTEDEVVARSFLITYRKRTQPTVKSVEIQYMEDKAQARWTPQPDPPRVLP